MTSHFGINTSAPVTVEHTGTVPTFPFSHDFLSPYDIFRNLNNTTKKTCQGASHTEGNIHYLFKISAHCLSVSRQSFYRHAWNEMRHRALDYLEKSLLQVRSIRRVIVFIAALLRDEGKTRAIISCLFFFVVVVVGDEGSCQTRTNACPGRSNCVTRGSPKETHQNRGGETKNK